ncbi:MAG: phosphoribosylglycinamide formyltransferase [Deltaproteobacteria bacterium]|nr:phosphoribosylglycinamide formyltransferase [Deltaproteobacteria bacterium]
MSGAARRESPLRVGVLASGNGSNLQAILDASASGGIDARVVVVISDKPEAFALARARRAGVPAVVIEKKNFASREKFDVRLVEILREHEVELVCLAGFMRILTPVVINAFPQRMLNIHPSLLPAFPGLDVQRKALEHGVRFSGCTVHVVDEGCDTGPIVIQAVVPLAPDDTPASLAARILDQEHRMYPAAIQLFAEGRIEIEGRRVSVRDAGIIETALVNPPPDDRSGKN